MRKSPSMPLCKRELGGISTLGFSRYSGGEKIRDGSCFANLGFGFLPDTAFIDNHTAAKHRINNDVILAAKKVAKMNLKFSQCALKLKRHL